MPPAAKLRSVRRTAPPAQGSRVLDDLMAGLGVGAIAQARQCTPARIEKILRVELQAISIRPAQDYAKLQIGRLEAMVGKLIEKANDGELTAVDRILKILDRLDRYHGFAKLAPTNSPSDDQAYQELMKKLSDLIARREQSKKKEA